MCRSALAALLSVLAITLAGSVGAQTVVSSNVTTDTTWSGTIILEGAIFVKNGALLTIDPGTIIRGQPRTGPVVPGSTVGTPGALIITQDGMIDADGTAAMPIIMTTAAVDNDGNGEPDDDDMNGFLDAWVPGDLFYDDDPMGSPLAPLSAVFGNANVSLWGGLVVLGHASTNLTNPCGTGTGSCTIEGLTVPGFPAADARYGGDPSLAFPGDPLGSDDADSSGTLRYISVRHAGDEIGADNELNGVSLGGVGSGTVMEYVEVYCNFDDGFEWFGGTVNGDHLFVVFQGDDAFDNDQGYRGTNQFLAAIMPFFNQGDTTNFGASSGDKGSESDGDDFPDLNNLPAVTHNADFFNFTIAGSAVTPYYGHVNDNDGWEMRNGWGGLLANGIIVNTADGAGPLGDRQGIDIAGDVAGNPQHIVTVRIPAGEVAADAITCKNVAAVPAAPSPETDTFANGSNPASDIEGCEFGDPVALTLVDDDTSFVPTGVAGKLDSSLGTIDLRPTAATTAGVIPGGVDPSATYRGAFEPSPAPAWVEGWTTLAKGGVIPVPEPTAATQLVAGVFAIYALRRRRS